MFSQSWEQTKGPYAGRATAMITVGNNIYVANRDYGSSDGRVYRSSNFGVDWVAADGGITTEFAQFTQFANIGETILGVANYLYKTTNQGEQWLVKQDGLFSQALSIEAIGNEFWCGTSGGGIFKSTNFGESWIPMNNGILQDAGTVIVYDIEYLNGDIFLATEGGGGPARLYRSSDMGLSWELANNGLPLGTNPHHFAVNGNTIFVSCEGDFAQYEYGLYKSTDNGGTWTVSNNGIPVILNGNTGKVWTHNSSVYVSTTFPDDSPKVYKSTNDGASFSPASVGLRNDNQQVYAYTAAGDYIFAGTGWYSTVFRSSDEAASWTESRRGLANSSVFSLMDKDGRLYAGSQEGLFYTEDMGNNWTEMQNGLPFGTPVVTMEKNGSSIYLGTDQYGMYRSTDNGNSWSQINNGLVGTYAESIEDLLYYNGNLYAATWEGVFKSTNNGDTWTAINSGLPGEFGGSVVTVNTVVEHNGALFIGTVLEGIYKSTDNGATWISSDSGLSFYAQSVRELISVGSDIFAATDSGVWKSSDNGASWQVNSVLNEGQFREIHSANGVLFASNYGPTVLTGFGIWRSTDSGMTWQMIEDGMRPDARLRDFELHNGYIFGATDTRSVWRWSEALSTLQATHQSVMLSPNPTFNQATITGDVDEFKIHDQLGRLIKTGKSSNIDLSTEPSGIYFVSIISGTNSQTLKLIKN